MENFKNNCQKSIDHFVADLGQLRGARANTSLVENISVDYYGSTVPLQQLGLVNAPEPRLLTVQVYDQGAIESIEKAIQQAELGLNPSREGNLIRIAIPALTEERRKDLIKKLRDMAEQTRVAIRNLRRDAVDKVKQEEKEGKSKDDSHREQEQIQKITDESTKEIDRLLADKEKEMMEV